MTREEIISDLEVLKQYFEDQSNAYPVCLDYAIKALQAEPVKHGEWIEGDMLECNQCHHKMIVGGGAYNFCPNCGARMKGGAK